MSENKSIVGISQLAGQALPDASADDDFFHPPASSGHYSSTETAYFGFMIPEEKLNAEIYLWFHPVLGTLSLSVYIWKGIKTSVLAADYVNHHSYLPIPEGNGAEFSVEDMGFHYKVIKPLEAVEIHYEDKARNVSFNLLSTAIMPPAVRPTRTHFTQAVKTAGELNLFGKKYRIDGYFSRDKSWSQERRENSHAIPPITWMVGVFNDNLAFHALAYDDPTLNPEWVDRYPQITPDSTLLWGYLYRDGKTKPLASVKKLTHRETDGISPRFFEVEMTDVEGDGLNLTGYVQARMPWQTWQNITVQFCQTRWHCDEGIGYGDAQDCQYNDYTYFYSR